MTRKALKRNHHAQCESAENFTRSGFFSNLHHSMAEREEIKTDEA
jgi:hypothetical protein